MAKLKPLIEDDDTTFDSFDMANTGAIQFAKKLPCALIQFAPAFKDLFAFNEELCTQITESIEQNGYDLSHPIQVWVKDDGTPILIDGHHRLAAAKRANLQEIPCVELRFSDEKDALLYAYSQQLDRRNLSDAELLSAIDAFIGIGGKRLNRDAIAERIGVSARTVSKAQAVLKDVGASHEVKENGKTINAAYNDLMDKKHPKAEKKATDKQDGEFADDSAQTDIGSFDDISDALDDTSGEPKAIVIGDHSDHIERPSNKLSVEEDSERTRERRKAYETGFFEGFLQAANYVLSAVVAEHALSSLYIDIFCNPAYHNYEQFTHMGANCYLDAEYKYSKFRKELLAERNLEDLNPAPIKEYSSQNGDLPLDFAKEESETEKSESSGPVTDLSTFNIDFAEGE